MAAATSRRVERAAAREDLELKQFRELMPPPDHWEEGFGLKAMVGAVFVGLIMTPASMYMQLVVGGDIGPAAQWVTIILFIEVARRSFTVLRRPEIYEIAITAAFCFSMGGLYFLVVRILRDDGDGAVSLDLDERPDLCGSGRRLWNVIAIRGVRGGGKPHGDRQPAGRGHANAHKAASVERQRRSHERLVGGCETTLCVALASEQRCRAGTVRLYTNNTWGLGVGDAGLGLAVLAAACSP